MDRPVFGVMPPENQTPILAAVGITKRFGAFTALDGVDFDLKSGEIHAVLGENGAGKSTLMNILSGLMRPTSGNIQVGGTAVRFSSPSDAERAGISMVHQHFLLVPPLTVRENLLLSAERRFGGPLTYPLELALTEVRELAERLGWQIPWNSPAGSLPVGTQQRVEILKALRGNTRVVIFDEPTAVLTPTETPELFATIRRLAAEGRGIVFISHKLNEVRELATRVTVLRRGRVVSRTTTQETDSQGLARAMVGVESEAATLLEEESENRERHIAPHQKNETRIVVEQLSLGPESGGTRPRLSGISLAVSSGEVFGVAGVDGNGQGELAECLSGLQSPNGGKVIVDGQELHFDAASFRHAGVAVIPADRHKRGLALPLSITENLALGVYDKAEFRRGPLLLWPKLTTRAAGLISRFDIRATGPRASVASLSGGNQQKVVIARALAEVPRVVIAVNPTRGLDVGAIAYVHNALREARDKGAAIVLISTELEEILLLSDRIAVLYEGRFTGCVPPTTSRETLGLLMGGKAA
jgi:simple sugar transport system ATP-binding protein